MGPSTPKNLSAKGLRIALIASRFNEEIVARLVAGAREALLRNGANPADLFETWVPGAWELPLAAQTLANTHEYDALICLGCVIRGETSHHLYVAGEAARGLTEVSLEIGIPIGFGLITTDTLEQAMDRAGGNHGNKGEDAALAAIEMAHLLKQVRSRKRLH